jgi:hypothetical protein
VGESSRLSVGSSFREAHPQRLKGLAEPVAVHRLVRGSGVRSRLDLAVGKLTPFVGREEEMGLLLSRWEQVKEGHGQVVLVDGEAGRVGSVPRSSATAAARFVRDARSTLSSLPRIAGSPGRRFASVASP